MLLKAGRGNMVGQSTLSGTCPGRYCFSEAERPALDEPVLDPHGAQRLGQKLDSVPGARGVEIHRGGLALDEVVVPDGQLHQPPDAGRERDGGLPAQMRATASIRIAGSTNWLRRFVWLLVHHR
jgi:hypothetical protein